MIEGWREIRLNEIAKIYSGFAFKSKEMTSAPFEGIPLVKIKNIFDRKVSQEFDSYLKHEFLLEKHKKYKLHKGDVLVAMTGQGSVGRIGKMHEVIHDIYVNQRVGIVRLNNNLADKEFVYQQMANSHNESVYFNLAMGAGQPNLSPKDIGNLKINLPPLPTQRKIASILSVYDDLIENNLKRIKLLEEKAQLTYEEWFVRMKFPGHETTPISQETGLPEGWEEVKLNEILKFNQGVQVPIDKQLKEKNPERVRFIRIVDVTQGGQEERFIETPRKNQMVVEKDLFMVRYGAPQIVTNFKGAIANNFFKINIIDSSKVFPKYVYCFLDRKEIREYLMGVSVSATMPAISFKSFGQIKMILPERNLQKKFHDYVDSIFEIILDFEKQNQRLKEARDILLPRLMTGMIDVEKMKLETLQPTTA